MENIQNLAEELEGISTGPVNSARDPFLENEKRSIDGGLFA
jgi:hypothetical protein